jgi:SanA protein
MVALALWDSLRRFVRNAVLAVIALVIIANVVVLWATAPVTYRRAADVPDRPVAIVLGTHVNHGMPSQELAERLQAASELYATHKVQTIIVSGANTGPGGEPAVMARWLTGRGVPAAAVIEDPYGVRTRASVERAVHVFGVTGAVLCTQGYHLPRALMLARKAGIDAVGLAADPSPSARHSLREILARPEMLLETLLWPVR